MGLIADVQLAYARCIFTSPCTQSNLGATHSLSGSRISPGSKGIPCPAHVRTRCDGFRLGSRDACIALGLWFPTTASTTFFRFIIVPAQPQQAKALALSPAILYAKQREQFSHLGCHRTLQTDSTIPTCCDRVWETRSTFVVHFQQNIIPVWVTHPPCAAVDAHIHFRCNRSIVIVFIVPWFWRLLFLLCQHGRSPRISLRIFSDIDSGLLQLHLCFLIQLLANRILPSLLLACSLQQSVRKTNNTFLFWVF